MHLLDMDDSELTELPGSSNLQSTILRTDRNRFAAPTDLSVWTTPIRPQEYSEEHCPGCYKLGKLEEGL